ncbi:unnamed protein product [Bemisia tabaci]|uniref:Uncharacterized protein n=1 Tax=Bemisia tabaci TaxID=7038 RepID=A0A9P0AN27_BEMTA|nr:unnamed protein product [Bemisia tabaci]
MATLLNAWCSGDVKIELKVNNSVSSTHNVNYKQIAVETGCAKIDWHVTEWNSGAREFYHHKGAICLSKLEDWLVYRLEKEAMTELYQKTTARQGTGTKGQQS